MGYVARTGQSQILVGDTGNTGIGRRNIVAVTNAGIPPGSLANQTAQRLCSLMDSIGSDNGVPNTDRELRYNFLWVIQRPNNANKNTANMTVVVFDRRAHLFAPTGSEQVLPRIPGSTVTFSPGSTSLSHRNDQADIKPGAWIMDGSVNPPGNSPARPGIRHANFYRVTAVSPQGANTQLELQSPIKTASDGSNNAYNGTLVILRGVSGVYPRPPLSPAD